MTGRHRLALGSYCFMVAAIPPAPALVFSLVFRRGSKYAITVSFISISWNRSNDIWNSGVHWNLALTFSSSMSGEVACPNLSMKSTFAPAKNRKDRTSTADCGVSAAFGAATLSGSGDMPSVENTFPKNFTARRLSQLFFRLSVSQCSRRSFNICLRALSCSSDVAPKTSMPSQMLIAFGCCAKTLQTSSLKISAALLTPKCSLLKSSMRVKCGKLPAFLGEFQLHVSIVHV